MPAPQTWAGHQVVFGRKKVPVIGKVKTRSDTFLLAHAVSREDGLSIEQQPCRVVFKKVAGVKTAMRSKKPGVLPRVVIEFVGLRGGWLQALPWRAGWSREDIDHDGHPGATVDVDSFFCSGEMYISNHSSSVARGHFVGDRFEGVLRTGVQQKVLDASSSCLKWGVNDREEKMQGTFVYVPVKKGSSCKSLLQNPWPALAAPLDAEE